MSKIVEQVTAANDDYAANFADKGSLAMPPARGVPF
ncbi:carbonic anhydrase [Thalassotalea sp. ND16A]|nr:carbonic anhydrase [Thalassotalea sp. ND16A]